MRHRYLLQIVISLLTVLAALPAVLAQKPASALVPNQITVGNRSFALNLPADFSIAVAAQGLKRVRFMAKSPDGRIFVTDMYNLADNTKGAVYILDEFDSATKSFKTVTAYLTGCEIQTALLFIRMRAEPLGFTWRSPIAWSATNSLTVKRRRRRRRKC